MQNFPAHEPMSTTIACCFFILRCLYPACECSKHSTVCEFSMQLENRQEKLTRMILSAVALHTFAARGPGSSPPFRPMTFVRATEFAFDRWSAVNSHGKVASYSANAGAGADAAGAGADAVGAGTDAAGAGADAVGAVMEAAGAWADAVGEGVDAAGAGADAVGAVVDAADAGADAACENESAVPVF